MLLTPDRGRLTVALTALLLVVACGDADDGAGSDVADAAVSPDTPAPMDVAPMDVAPMDVAPGDTLAPDVSVPEVLTWPPLAIDERDLVAFVDPMIGTDGSGNAIPGALVPHGMVRLSPDTRGSASRIGAYEYGDTHIEGFSHTHLEGPGGSGNGYSHIQFMPVAGTLAVGPEAASPFSHTTEAAAPGYYAVTVGEDPAAVGVELTATGHTGLHRYTFPQGQDAWVGIDVGHSMGNSEGGEVTVIDDRTIEGYGRYNVHPLISFLLGDDEPTGISTVYFHARFSRPFAESGIWRGKLSATLEPGEAHGEGKWLGVYAGFGSIEAPGVLDVQVGISMVSTAQAARNLDVEVGAADFESVRAQASERWNTRLNRVQLEGDPGLKRVFYTALYHSMFQPADYTEADGVFFNASDGIGEALVADGWRYYTDDWCVWDTFRTSHPLATLVEPDVVDDGIRSWLHIYERGGWLPKCTWHASGYSRVMTGNHAVSVIADAITKGFSGFDHAQAWEACLKAADDDNPNPADAIGCGYLNLGTPPDYLTLGYIPTECDATQSVSMTMEYAYDDWCTARIAEALGKKEQRDRLDARAQSYRAHWDPEVGFFRALHRDGSWVEPFDPDADGDANDYVEATAWIFLWAVPQDVPALVKLIGGEETFVERLDTYFASGRHDMSNQPGFHTPWLYNFVGRPDRTQEQVRELLLAHWRDAPNGLPGNDDAGSTSAWFVLGALGIYPVAPGDGVYQLTAPLFDEATVHLHPLHAARTETATFTIAVRNPAPERVYIAGAWLNGEALTQPTLRHEQLTAGGRLELELSDVPADWGRR